MELSIRSADRSVADSSMSDPKISSALWPGMAGRTRGAGIAAMGMCVPDRVLTNLDLERMVDTSDEWIVSRTGISERRIVSAGEATSDLALGAARAALARGEVLPRDLDLIIVGTITPDMPFPGVANLIQDRLGASHAAAFDLSAGCAGFVYALATGAQFVQTGAYRHVLAIGADVVSRVLDWTDRSTCVLFGDGAGAALLTPVEPGEGLLAFDLGSDGGGAGLICVEAGGTRLPASPETLAAGRHTVKMVGSEVFKFAVRIIEETTLRALDRAGLGVSEIDLFIAHQANLRIIESAIKRLGLPPERVFNNVQKYGNTSAGSVPIALAEAIAAGRVKRGDIVVLVGFGSGLSWATAVLRWV
jgi:3-oxoacyl-[acyl-carrier-protein] synthase-3